MTIILPLTVLWLLMGMVVVRFLWEFIEMSASAADLGDLDEEGIRLLMLFVAGFMVLMWPIVLSDYVRSNLR